MLADLDRLMASRGVGVVVVPLHELRHPSFRWLARGARVTRGFALRTPGETYLFHDPMERDEAAVEGLRPVSLDHAGRAEIFRRNAEEARAWSELLLAMRERTGARGSVALLGPLPFPLYLGVAEELERRGVALWRGDDLVELARKRKEEWEIERIASVGRRTEAVVERVREVLRAAEIRDGKAYRDGSPLTIGHLKGIITSEIQRLGMVEDHETIVSQGRDAGVPHSRGDRAALVRAGIPLVIDIFPADRESGYFFDLTRTFCVGGIPDQLRALHAEVLAAFESAAETIRAGEPASQSHERVCERFERAGHPTSRSHPGTTDGYVHGLGHGVGLEVHERPSFSLAPANADRIEEGDVLTIEPGLYYPGRELGVRIEETFFIDRDGRAVSLCSSPRGLEP